MYADKGDPFFLSREDGSVLQGYFLPPSTPYSPIIFAIQGSSCESSFRWYLDLSDQASSCGVGLVVLEKQGISRDGINLFEYNQNNCLQKRQEDYIFCLENLHLIASSWEGKAIFWGESEGGLLAANLASQVSKTAAVLLFATGGGMKPREEVKWTIRHRLEEHGASENEIDQYMIFLDGQLDIMVLNPSATELFLGNTYKWWAALLAADAASISLSQLSLPIYLVHGKQDDQIPVASADLAAEILKENNALTYLPLEGYGHNLGYSNIQASAFVWLNSILLGGEQRWDNQIASQSPSLPLISNDWENDISHYVFSRGSGEASIGFGGSKDTKGNEYARSDITIFTEIDENIKIEGKIEGNINKDNEGNIKGECKIEGRFSWNL